MRSYIKRIISLTSNKNFKRAYTQGYSYSSNLATLYLYTNNLGKNRVGYSVKKKLGKAIIRNRIKRRFREAYRQYFKYLKEGYDIILVAKTPVLKANLKDIEICFIELFRKSGIFEC